MGIEIQLVLLDSLLLPTTKNAIQASGSGNCELPSQYLPVEVCMLYYAVVFFIIAIIAAIFGFGGIAAGAAGIAKILFFVFAVLFIASLFFGRRR
ncbi:hypothetical protein A6456_34905 [Paraburkholderia tropica]|nr:hypothetical protein A6456_34905 [Paraburkholderia tropica]